MPENLKPLTYSHVATALEAELRDLFIKLYTDALAATADDINVYGAPFLGSFSLVERSIDQDGLTVLRETTEDRIRYLFKAWRHRNPERGLHFLRLYLSAIFGERQSASQLWQKTSEEYPLYLRTRNEIEGAGDSLDDYFLTSRVRVDVDSDIVPAKLLASLRSSVAARILLNVRIGRVIGGGCGVAAPAYGAMVLRLSNVPPYLPPRSGDYVLSTDGMPFMVVTEDGVPLRLEGTTTGPGPDPDPDPIGAIQFESGEPFELEAGGNIELE